MTHDLLRDPLLSVETTNGVTHMSLPELFASLQSDEVLGFPNLLPHQTHPWHAFLVQLAVIALEGEDLPESPPGHAFLPEPRTPDAWRERLRALTSEYPNDEPWHLVVEDLGNPAFFQPPAPEGAWNVFKKDVYYPDDLDILIPARNHGLKDRKFELPSSENWIYALMAIQTFGGFLGQGNYNASRMNGGFATRPGIGLESRSRPGGRWARDVRVLLDNPGYFQARQVPFDPSGHRLLWLLPWDGTSSLSVDVLHPLYIEVCRRIRLRSISNGMQAHTVGTKTTRIAAKELKGNLADPWIPIRETESAAYNKRPTYRAARSVLFPFDQDPDRFRPPLLLQRHPPDQGHELAARFRVLVRGQGKTEGYFDRLIPIPQEVESFIFDSTDDSPARLAQAFVELAATARNSVLKPALLRYMQAAKDKISFKQPETNDWAQTWANRLEDIVDETFFPTLWESLPILERAEQVDAQIPWRKQLREAVQAIFDEAVDSLPVIDALEYKARANAEGKLYYGLRKHLSIQIETEGAQP